MSDIAEAVTPAFTINQLQTLASWSASRPRGFRHVLVQCYDNAEEVAELTQREAYHQYHIRPTVTGCVELGVTYGGEVWEMDCIEKALETLLAIEEEIEIELMATAK